jgi:restriction system protein
MSEIVFDLTFEFTKLYVSSYKQKDQMEGAARGGKQNISEGSQTSGTSKQSELRLVDVARASLEELLQDYEDFLRTNKLSKWNKDDERVIAVRKLCYKEDRSYRTYMTYMSDKEAAADCLITLINQTNYLLDQQLRALEKDLAEKGDFKDRYKKNKKENIIKTVIDDNDGFDQLLKDNGLKRGEDGKIEKLGQ